MMSSQKIMSSEEIRMELARQKRTRVEIAKQFGLSYDYICRIVKGTRDAKERRKQITEYLRGMK
ncbi:MAG TPA: hypothetical protein PKH17_03750 [Candidatus Syntrophosphaera sp.]|nr:hypothetical protein [Candidatus Syntrophosphaera sp.]